MTENLTKKLKKKKGFTLIELIIVVAIIAILAALALPKLMGTQENAKKKADIANGKVIHDVAAKMMTEGTLSSTDSPQTINGSSKIDGEMQTHPVAQYSPHKNQKFVVTITGSGTDSAIKVTLDTDTGTQVYPDSSGY